MPDNPVLVRALTTLLTELVDGGTGNACYVLNPSDPGLLRSLGRLSAAEASAPAPGGGPSIAAHVDHLCYGFELMNRWTEGEEDAFANADFSLSWQRTRVSDDEWAELRRRLESQIGRWRIVVPHLDAGRQLHVTGAMASIVHLAYHLGAIRQVNRELAGPPSDGR